MIIDDVILNKLEKLSALKIPENKRDEIKNQLNNIVDFVEILNELNLDDTQVAFTTLKGGTPFREDEPKKSAVIDTIIKHAPESDGSYFVVPKIIE